MKKLNKKGFTLIEIIVVVVVLAVLMAVAVPSVLKYVHEADNAKYMAQGRSVMNIAQTEVVKAYVGDSKIDANELATLTNNATYSVDGLTVTDVKIYTAASVSEVNGKIVYAGAPTALTASTNLPTIAAVECTLDTNKHIVAVPNGKIYVNDAAPTVAE